MDLKQCQKFPPSKEKLLLMLLREEQLKLSKEYIEQCSLVHKEVNGWLRITEEVQKKVCFEFGYTDILRNILAVNYLRRAQYLYPDDDRFKNTQVYVRNN